MKKIHRYDLEIPVNNTEVQELSDSEPDVLHICEHVQTDDVEKATKSKLKVNTKTAKKKEGVKRKSVQKPSTDQKKKSVALKKNLLECNPRRANLTRTTDVNTNVKAKNATSATSTSTLLTNKAIDELFGHNLRKLLLSTEELRELYIKYKLDGHFRIPSTNWPLPVLPADNAHMTIAGDNVNLRSQSLDFDPHAPTEWLRPNSTNAFVPSDWEKSYLADHNTPQYAQNFSTQYNTNANQGGGNYFPSYESTENNTFLSQDLNKETMTHYNYPLPDGSCYNMNIENNHLQIHNLAEQKPMPYQYSNDFEQLYKMPETFSEVENKFYNSRNNAFPINLSSFNNSAVQYNDRTSGRSMEKSATNPAIIANPAQVNANFYELQAWNTARWKFLYSGEVYAQRRTDLVYPIRNTMNPNEYVQYQTVTDNESYPLDNYNIASSNSFSNSMRDETLTSVLNRTDESFGGFPVNNEQALDPPDAHLKTESTAYVAPANV